MPLSSPPRRPAMLAPSPARPDPYQLLALSVFQRACDDARGHCAPPVSRPVEELQQEAHAWLASDEAAQWLELAGYEPGPVLRRVRETLNLAEKGTCA
jgi:hypothetical protein